MRRRLENIRSKGISGADRRNGWLWEGLVKRRISGADRLYGRFGAEDESAGHSGCMAGFENASDIRRNTAWLDFILL